MPRKSKFKPGEGKLANLRLEKQLFDDASDYAKRHDETFSRLVRRLLRAEIYSDRK